MNDLPFGEMEWRDDDLGDLRTAMDRLSTGYMQRSKQLSTEANRQRTIAYLQEARKRHIENMVPLETIFTAHSTMADLLDELLKSDILHGFVRIRYRFTETLCNEGYYVLLDSAGYDDNIAALLRVGELVRFQSSCPLNRSDTFWAHHLGVPVAVTVEKSTSGCIAPSFFLDCIPLLEIPHDSCEESLAGHKSATWVDIPLSVFGKHTGKLTCDFGLPPNRLTSCQGAIMSLWAIAQIAAPYLEFMGQQEAAIPQRTIEAEVQACHTLEALYEYCTQRLPAYFGACNASLFTVSRDSFGMEKLVLQRTSFPSAKANEGKSHYRFSDKALTVWVARNNKSLRLHNLADEREREQQLDQYRVFDSQLQWEDKVTDSSCHSSYLAVPIPTATSSVGGVLRLTQKEPANRRFTTQEEKVLERIARDTIGRQLVHLTLASQSTNASCKIIQDTNYLMVANRVPKTADIVSMTRTAFQFHFPRPKNGRRLFLMNILTNDCNHFEHFRIDGELDDDLQEQKAYALDGSLTEYVVRSFLTQDRATLCDNRVVFVNDFENARHHRAMLVICNSAETALASPVSYGGKIYGVIGIKSDHHDIAPETHGHTLEIIAAQAGAMFARRDHYYLTKLRQQVEMLPRHDCVEWLESVDKLFSGKSDEDAGMPLVSLNLRRLIEGVVKKAGCRADSSIPDIEVMVQQPSLVGVMYSVLKDICTRASHQPVKIRGDVQNAWIELTVEEFFTKSDPLNGEMWDESPNPEVFLGATGADSVTLSRKLAYYSEVNNRWASLSKNDSDLVLRFPMG